MKYTIIIIGVVIILLLLLMYYTYFKDFFDKKKKITIIQPTGEKKNLLQDIDFFNNSRPNILKSTRFELEGTNKQLNIIDMGNGKVLIFEDGIYEEDPQDLALANEIVAKDIDNGFSVEDDNIADPADYEEFHEMINGDPVDDFQNEKSVGIVSEPLSDADVDFNDGGDFGSPEFEDTQIIAGDVIADSEQLGFGFDADQSEQEEE